MIQDPGFTFDQLIAPFDPAVFFADHFERAPLVLDVPRPDRYRGLFELEDVDRFLTGGEHRYPDVYLVDAANPDLKPQDYCVTDQRIDVGRLYEMFASGATIVLFGIENRIPALRRMCRSLERVFGYAFDTNVYLTPPQARGLRAHYDNHDVFVLQLLGSKAWTLYDQKIVMPLPGQSFARTHPEAGPVSREFTLAQGDLLYCPRGLMHSAEATDGISLHITVGLKGRSWTELMLEAVSALALEDAAFRRLLPVGHVGPDWDRDAASAHFRLLAGRLAALDPLPLIDAMADSFAAGRPHPATRHLGRATADTLTLDTQVSGWPDLIYRVEQDDDTVTLIWQGADLTFPAFVSPSLVFALSGKQIRIKDIPGELDDEGRLVLARRLFREGIIAS